MTEKIIENNKDNSEEVKEIKEVNSVKTIDDNFEILKNKISETENKNELETLYQQFNINNTKKNAIRIVQLNNLLDKVNAEAEERFTKRPEQISNKELLDYMNAISNQIDRSQKIVNDIKEINSLQVNSNNQNTVTIHVNGDTSTTALNKESRKKIADIVSSIINDKKINQDIIDADISDNKKEHEEE